ncbi:ABC transporter substrate-binding protein [Methylobrevis pamukkalensis]|uniref:Periplasmic dipeptide transport protein n=1 Tax=Methylobrevis pamukkalensis TaxID=1439726 RepID=A0A1E3H212_9HYPH|nr:ABC transporter substrate-binding protein [Methylobrevis pamukkalensis]ODN70357.1 Periplasmic dipeptide transport protein precursor [Methylobrevis pamukkalensis]
MLNFTHRPTGRRAGLALLAAALLGHTSLAHAQEDRAALMEAHRGGTLVLSAVAAAGTIDPMVNYTAQFWQVFQMTYDGLLKFKQASRTEGFQIVPSLAEALPEAENDGKTYVFKLRKGIKFSNGKELTASDVVASFQRIFKISSPTSGSFYNGIVGADACIAAPADCTLEGGVIGDDAAGTVTINLTQPDAEFFAKIAVPHASIVPAGTPATDAAPVPCPAPAPT